MEINVLITNPPFLIVFDAIAHNRSGDPTRYGRAAAQAAAPM
jgi:hypothetical protein